MPGMKPAPEPAPAASADAPCPCGLASAYAACCGRWHAGPQHLAAPDAPSLMRSRYTAYVLQLPDYLRETWHPRTRPASITFDTSVRWLGLDIRRQALIDPQRATVEFVARSKLAGRAHRLHETSVFVNDAGRWFYLHGDIHGG